MNEIEQSILKLDGRLKNAGLEDAVDGFVQTEENGEARKEAIMRGFAELAEG